jgi:hypothetical protein
LPRDAVHAVISFDEETIRAAESESNRQYRTQNSIKKATWGAVIAASVYAFISLFVWWQMVKQNRIAEAQLRQSLESFRVDERAWIEIEPIKPVLKNPASSGFGALFTYNIYPKNVGKTGAFDIIAKAIRGAPMSDLSLGDNADEIGRYQNMLSSNSAGMPEVLVSRRVPKTLGPGMVSISPFDIYGQEPQVFKNGSVYQFLVGRIDYTDAFRVKHWMRFCFFISDASGNIQYCQEGNDKDRNPELPPN